VSRAQRLLDLIQVLRRHRHPVSGAVLAEATGVSLRTLYRDIDVLKAEGAHIDGEAGVGYVLRPGFMLPPLMFSEEEIEALVLGSRWVPGGKMVNWPRYRQFISWGGNTYARLMLGISVRDATGGFRAYRADTLRKIALDEVISQGYCFQIDLTLRTIRAGLTLTEIPITFVERVHGTSKMSNAIVREAFWRVTQWGLSGRAGRLRARRTQPGRSAVPPGN